MAVSYDYYRIFYYVGRYGSFTRAAQVLGNNQPNITRAMNNLEAELGCRLFSRSHKGTMLTPEGERLWMHVRVAFEHLQRGEQELLAARGLENGSVSISVTETALRCFLLPILREFHHRHPGIHIQIANHSTTQAVRAVRQGLAELAVVTTPTVIEKPLREEVLREIRDILIAGPEYRKLCDGRQSLASLADYPLISLSQDSGTHFFYEQLFASKGLLFRPAIEAATTDQILPMVEHDIGIGFVPYEFAAAAVKQGRVFEIPIKEEIPSRYISMILDASAPLSIAAGALKTIMDEYVVPTQG